MHFMHEINNNLLFTTVGIRYWREVPPAAATENSKGKQDWRCIVQMLNTMQGVREHILAVPYKMYPFIDGHNVKYQKLVQDSTVL